jgi:hypothetical protein
VAKRAGGVGVGLGVLGMAGLVVLALVLALRSQPRRPAPTPSAPTASERFPNAWPAEPPSDVAALLDGLGPGSPLTGKWRVRGVSPVEDHRIVVDVDRGDAGFRVWIVRRDQDSRLPPKQTERYALYTAQPRPNAEALQDEDYGEVLDALVERIARTETKLAIPAGM